MKILIVGIVRNFQAKRLKEEGEKRGHIVDLCRTDDLAVYSDSRTFDPKVLALDTSSYDLIYSFATKRRWEWYLTFLHLNKKYQTIIVNQRIISQKNGVFLAPVSLADYFRQTENNLPYPKSITFYCSKAIPEITEKLTFPMIVKSSVGKQGKLVFKVDNRQELQEIVKKLEPQKNALVAREFIPNDGDIRVFTIGYKAVAGMRRIPKEGEFRSNISQGGRGEAFDLSNYPEVSQLAENMAKVTETEIAGVDIIINKETGHPFVLEINANPQFEGLEKYTGTNIAVEIIKYFEDLGKEGGEN